MLSAWLGHRQVDFYCTGHHHAGVRAAVTRSFILTLARGGLHVLPLLFDAFDHVLSRRVEIQLSCVHLIPFDRDEARASIVDFRNGSDLMTTFASLTAKKLPLLQELLRRSHHLVLAAVVDEVLVLVRRGLLRIDSLSL